MRKQVITAMAALMALHLTGCAAMGDVEFPFSKNETETTQEETKEITSTEKKEVKDKKKTKVEPFNLLKKASDESDPITHVKEMLKENMERYAKDEAMFVELIVNGEGFTQTMISACSPEGVVSAIRKESDILSAEGILLYNKDGDDWVMMTAEKGDTKDDVVVSSVNEQMKQKGYKTDSSDLSGFELLTLNLADLNIKEAQEKNGELTARGSIQMLDADVTVSFNENGQLTQFEYKRTGETGIYRFYAENGPNEDKGEEVAERFLDIIKTADNYLSSAVEQDITSSEMEIVGDYKEPLMKTDPSSTPDIYKDGVPLAIGAVVDRIPAGDIPGWETNEHIQKAMKEVQGHIGETVMDAPFGCSWLEFEDSQRRYAPGETVWVPSAFLAFTDNGDFTSEKHEVYILVKLKNDTNEDQIYTRMTIQGVREK